MKFKIASAPADDGTVLYLDWTVVAGATDFNVHSNKQFE
jgi:hypothetical protein